MEPEAEVPPIVVNAVALRATVVRRETEEVRVALDPEFLITGLSRIDFNNHSRAARLAIEHIHAGYHCGLRSPVFHKIRKRVIVASRGIGTIAAPESIRCLIIVLLEELKKMARLPFLRIILKYAVQQSATDENDQDREDHPFNCFFTPFFASAVIIKVSGHRLGPPWAGGYLGGYALS